MTETNTAITEAIVKCDEIKARLETLRDMLKPKPVLRLESITRPGTYRELRSADDLIDCAPSTVLVVGEEVRLLRTCAPEKPWVDEVGYYTSPARLWRFLVREANNGVTLKYLAAH
jgi:hypothetical protein